MFLFYFFIALASCLIWDDTDFDTIFMYGDNSDAQCGVANTGATDDVTSADIYGGLPIRRKRMACSTNHNTITVFTDSVVGILGECDLIDLGSTGDCNTDYVLAGKKGADDYQIVDTALLADAEITGLWCGVEQWFILTDEGKLYGSGLDNGYILSTGGTGTYSPLTLMNNNLVAGEEIIDIVVTPADYSSDYYFGVHALVNDTATSVVTVRQIGYHDSYAGTCLTSIPTNYDWTECDRGFFSDFRIGQDFVASKIFPGYRGWWMSYVNGTESGIVYSGTAYTSGVESDTTSTLYSVDIEDYAGWANLKGKDIESIHCTYSNANDVYRTCVALVGQAEIYTWGTYNSDASLNLALCPDDRATGVSAYIPALVTHNIEDVYEAVAGQNTIYISGNLGNSLFACGSNEHNQISSSDTEAYGEVTVTGRHLLANGYKRFFGGYGEHTIYMGGRASFFTASLFVFAVVFFLF